MAASCFELATNPLVLFFGGSGEECGEFLERNAEGTLLGEGELLLRGEGNCLAGLLSVLFNHVIQELHTHFSLEAAWVVSLVIVIQTLPWGFTRI